MFNFLFRLDGGRVRDCGGGGRCQQVLVGTILVSLDMFDGTIRWRGWTYAMLDFLSLRMKKIDDGWGKGEARWRAEHETRR